MKNKSLKLAIETALIAGDAILDIYKNEDFKITLKDDKSPFTKADFVSNQIIGSSLKNTRIPILSEEEKQISFKIRKEWKKFWLIDPIDGTKEFIKKNDEFTVNIALIEDKSPILGVVYAPAKNIIYFSSRGEGAFKSDVDLNYSNKFDYVIANKVKLPIEKINQDYTVVVSRSHLSQKTRDFINQLKDKHQKLKLIPLGSSVKLCLVAEGTANCYARFAPLMEWDIAAGVSLLCETGKLSYSKIEFNTEKLVTEISNF
mgnify:CR=1 FL=1